MEAEKKESKMMAGRREKKGKEVRDNRKKEMNEREVTEATQKKRTTHC